MSMNKGPHEGQPVAFAGEPLDRALAAMIMLHGRGATSQDILSLVPLLAQPHFAYLAPQASGNTWYPNRFRVSRKFSARSLSSSTMRIR